MAGNVKLYEGHNVEHLLRMIDRGDKVHSVACDPPYGLVSIVKRFGKSDAAPAKKTHGGGVYERSSRNFIGQQWDSSGIENDPEFWKLVYEVMLPGSYIVAFSSPSTYHMMAMALQNAGFRVLPMIGWCYGSGMPHAHAVKHSAWDGWFHSSQVLKPALEPIFVGQKPYSEKTATANVLKHGVGAMNIEATRAPGGRWPANVITDGTLAAKFDIFEAYRPACYECGDSGVIYTEMQCIGDAPTLECCHHCFGQALDPSPFDDQQVFYVPKAGKADRAGGAHPTVKPISLMQTLIRRITPPGGTVLDPFAGSGTTGQAARNEGVNAVLMEMERPYAEFIRRRFDLPLTADDMLGEVITKLRADDML